MKQTEGVYAREGAIPPCPLCRPSFNSVSVINDVRLDLQNYLLAAIRTNLFETIRLHFFSIFVDKKMFSSISMFIKLLLNTLENTLENL